MPGCYGTMQDSHHGVYICSGDACSVCQGSTRCQTTSRCLLLSRQTTQTWLTTSTFFPSHRLHTPLLPSPSQSPAPHPAPPLPLTVTGSTPRSSPPSSQSPAPRPAPPLHLHSHRLHAPLLKSILTVTGSTPPQSPDLSMVAGKFSLAIFSTTSTCR